MQPQEKKSAAEKLTRAGNAMSQVGKMLIVTLIAIPLVLICCLVMYAIVAAVV
jgi:cell division protein FtsL